MSCFTLVSGSSAWTLSPGPARNLTSWSCCCRWARSTPFAKSSRGAPHGFDEDGLRLVEIVNRVDTYRSPLGPRFGECTYRISRFRPLRTTSIDVFTKMLEPELVRELVAAD